MTLEHYREMLNTAVEQSELEAVEKAKANLKEAEAVLDQKGLVINELNLLENATEALVEFFEARRKLTKEELQEQLQQCLFCWLDISQINELSANHLRENLGLLVWALQGYSADVSRGQLINPDGTDYDHESNN